MHQLFPRTFAEKARFCLQLGAELINQRQQRFALPKPARPFE
jgi:hypothetical protein